jgi:type I restriction enzyme, S subunit
MKKKILNTLEIWTTAQTVKSNGRSAGIDNQKHYGIEKLRELILELAIRGKLVPQDPNDEPASFLLKKITKENNGKTLKKKIYNEISTPQSQYNFEIYLPNNCVKCKFGDVIKSIISGGTPNKSNPNYWGGDIPWASVKDLGKTKYLNYTIDSITEEGLIAGSKQVDTNDIILCTRMGLGKIAIASMPIAINQDLKGIKLFSNIDTDYFLLFFKSLRIKGKGTTVEGIRQEELLNINFSLPPLPEQHRIVAKVDELMALCDQLEKEQTENNNTQQALVETLLKALINSTDHKEFAATWQRIAELFDILFTTEYSMDQLKQTILQLAVMGKLVPQDPNDEPAIVLLEKIAKEKERLVKEGKIKLQEKLEKTINKEKPYELPNSWTWTRLGDVTNYGTSEKVEPVNVDDLTWVLELEDIEKGSSNLIEKVRYCNRRFQSSKNQFSKGDVIYGKLRPYLDKVIVADEDGICTTEMIPINGYNKIYNFYIRLILKSPYFVEYANNSTHGMNLPRLGTNAARLAFFPLAPYSEQHRIIAKVNELFSLCDALKERIAASQKIKMQLADAVVEHAIK